MAKQMLKIQEYQNGVFLEKVNKELERVANDIVDINKKAESKRKVTATIEFVPDEDGQAGKVLINVSSTLGKQRQATGSVYFAETEEGKGVMSEKFISSLGFDSEAVS